MPMLRARTFAYSYSDPLLESVPDVSIWGRKVDQMYHDIGDRHQLQQLFVDCRREPVACLLVRRLEELGDSIQEISDRLAILEELKIPLILIQAEIELIAAEPITTEPIATLEQGVRRSDLLQVLTAIQAEQRSRRLRQAHARNRIKALPPPGKAPYGYRRGKERYTLDRTTAPIVKDFVEHFILYGSLRGSVRHLQKKYNKKISASTGKRWLTSPVYRGDLVYQNGEIIQNTHVAIISREEAAQVDRLLRRNRRMPPRTASAPRSLSGLVSCGTCQSSMKISHVTARQGKDYLYLTPTACPQQPKCRSISYAQVLEQTIQNICRELPIAVAQAPLPDVDGMKQGLTAEITAKQTILNQIPELLRNGILDAETVELRSYNLRTEMAALQNKLAQLPPVNLQTIAQVVSIPQFWLDLSESERRFYFREFIRQIQIVRSGKEWQVQLVFIF